MSLGPFDLTGGPFLTLYVVLLVLTLIAGIVIPRWLRPEGRSGRVTDAERLAFLAGGRQRFFDAIVTRLLAADALSLIGKKGFVTAPGGAGRSEPERGLLAAARGGPAGWKQVEQALQPYAATTEDDLVDAGLVMDRGVVTQLRFWQASPYLVLLVFGLIKLDIGEARGRPVGYLTVLLVATFVLAVIRFAAVDRRTRAGIDLLAEARDRSERLRRAPTSDETHLAVALFGTGVLAGSAWSGYHALRSASDGSAGGGCSTSGGGCGGGGGGGGCGGCGS
ncbi:MAG: rane protein [Sphingomonas bacterium]|nr:rane protein [Sphingomonas bacterium]